MSVDAAQRGLCATGFFRSLLVYDERKLFPARLPTALVVTVVGLAVSVSLFADTGPCTIERIAGTTDASFLEGVPATEAELLGPFDMAVGPDGLLYVLDAQADTIVRVNSDGALQVVAGNGDRGPSGDGGPAREASFLEPSQFRIGSDGAVFVRERGAIRRVWPSGIIGTFVKVGEPGKFGIGETVEEQGLHDVSSFDVGPDGALYLTSNTQHRIYRVSPGGAVSVFAGAGNPIPDEGGYNGDGGPAIEAELDRPEALAVAPDGTVYFADGRTSNERIRRIRTDGVIETYMTRAGVNANEGTLRTEVGYSRRSGLQVDGQGRLYWIDTDLLGIRLKRIGLDDRIERIWQAGELPLLQRFLVADSGVYVLAHGQVLRVPDEPGETEMVAGKGVPNSAHGSGGPALEAALIDPSTVAVGADGRIFVAEASRRRVRSIEEGTIQEYAGNGLLRPFVPLGGSLAGEGGPALEASFRDIRDLAVTPIGGLLIADGPIVRRVHPNGVIDRYAGDGLPCPAFGSGFGEDCGDDGPATEAQIGSNVLEVEMDRFGNSFILSNENRGRIDWVRRVGVDGTIHTLGGGLETAFRVNGIGAIAIRNGESLLAYTFGDGIWSVDQAGDATPLPTPRGILFQSAELMTASPSGDIYVWNRFSGLLQLRPEGSVNLVLPGVFGGASSLDRGDGGPPRAATTGSLGDIASDSEGNLYLADRANRVIRRINAPHECPQIDRPQISAVTNASFFPGGFGPGSIITIFGSGLGPSEGVVATPDEERRFPSDLAGIRVLIDGVEATVLYASATQVNAIIPFGAEVVGRYRSRRGGSDPFFTTDVYAELRVARDGVDSDPQIVAMEPASPAFLLLPNEQAAAINQDGSINSEQRPAAPGSAVALYMSGGGVMSPAIEDGAIVGSTLPQVTEKVVVLINGQEVEALYAGGAPGLVAGVLQVNFAVPMDLSQSGRIEIGVRVGLQPTNKAAYLWVR